MLIDSGNPNYSSVGGLIYSKDQTTLYAYPALEAELIIPDWVRHIDERAFVNNSQLQCVVIGDSVQSIGKSAFLGCRSLSDFEISPRNPYFSSEQGILYSKDRDTLIAYPSVSGSYEVADGVKVIAPEALMATLISEVILPESLTTISDKSFLGSGNMSTIQIGKSVNEIGSMAFSGCALLRELNIDSMNSNYSSYGGMLFNKEQDQLLAYPAVKDTLRVLDQVTMLGDKCFLGCRGLK